LEYNIKKLQGVDHEAERTKDQSSLFRGNYSTLLTHLPGNARATGKIEKWFQFF